ncbi:MAG: tRNA dihydrouridine synthase DusB [Kangiellaceae bacterium]|nr:tRNA dihydrouridine synthase DusB [Kangiellaceae bacterium]
MKIGPYLLDNNLFLAPMAGVTDLPFRKLCKRMGAGVVVSEMVTADPALQNSRKTKLRLAHSYTREIDDRTGKDSDIGLRVIQIAGGDAEILASAAVSNAAKGAQIIDINMGCPAKKVCKKAAGSALLKDPKLVDSILKAVVGSVDIPVTLKIRTGWDRKSINALQIARIAEDNGIQSLAVHGRTKACKYEGFAEHDTVALIKQSVSIPVIANGDIDSPETAKKVLEYTGADGLMVGRAAQGRPWIFREISYFLENNQLPPAIAIEEIKDILVQHVASLHQFYGEHQGVRIARKHTSWYLANDILSGSNDRSDNARRFKKKFNTFLTASEQLSSLNNYFEYL